MAVAATPIADIQRDETAGKAAAAAAAGANGKKVKQLARLSDSGDGSSWFVNGCSRMRTGSASSMSAASRYARSH